MKRFFSTLVMVGLLAGGLVAAPVLAPLPMESRAALGATHELVFSYSDLTVSATNTVQSFTNAIPAKTALQFVMLKLQTAFDTGNTNYTGSVGLVAGDGSDADLFVTSTELASDGTEVFLKFGPPNAYTISSTLQTNTVVSAVAYTLGTNTLVYVSSFDGTNSVLATNTTVRVATITPSSGAVVSAASITAATTVGEVGYKLYTADGSIVTTFTPNLNEALSANSSGQVTLYFKMFDAR